MILLHVCNRHTAETVNLIEYDHAIVSISTPGDPIPNVVENHFTKGVLYLQFHDLDREPGDSFREVYGDPILFSEKDAQDISYFVHQWRSMGVMGFLIHCDAGQSRSVGVAAALARHYNGDDGEWWSAPGPYASPRTPNRHVYRLMLEALHVHERDHV
jgi:predicted protein tyrosine phosphatase